jgi:hypothetical protein
LTLLSTLYIILPPIKNFYPLFIFNPVAVTSYLEYTAVSIAYYLARINAYNDNQVDKAGKNVDIGNITTPDLVDACLNPQWRIILSTCLFMIYFDLFPGNCAVILR